MADCSDDMYRDILTSLEGNRHYKAISEYLIEPGEDCQLGGDERNRQAERFLEWARTRQHMKIISCVIPDGILPKGYHGNLVDVRVFTKRGPDDDIFENNKDIRDKVARGNSFLKLFYKKQHLSTTCIVHALKKFTGGLGDDDDRDKGDNFTWKKYFTKPLGEATSIVATRKANGEAAHLSCECIEEQFIICAGSKNVHLLFTEKDDIDKYTEPRFLIAKEVAFAIADFLDSLKSEIKQRLLRFLCATKFTAVFEILQPHHQHVEDLSYLKRAELKFITWTSSNLEPHDESSLNSLAPHVGIEVARSLGLTAVDYEVLSIRDVDARMSQIRQGYGYEGEVLYFLDSSNSVIGLLKKKTIWYIICRALREKIKAACTKHTRNPDNFSISEAIRKTHKRIDEIQIWLGLDDQSVRDWKELGGKCIRWVIDRRESAELTHAQVADMFPVVWKRFLKDSGLTDKIMAQWKEPEGSDE